MSGELPLGDTSPQVTQLLLSDEDKIGDALETSTIPWSVNNYITLEPMQEKILALQSEESIITQLLHLARLRGGISDLLEVLNLKIDDD